jgi:hypothetical protein
MKRLLICFTFLVGRFCFINAMEQTAVSFSQLMVTVESKYLIDKSTKASLNAQRGFAPSQQKNDVVPTHAQLAQAQITHSYPLSYFDKILNFLCCGQRNH